MGIDVYAKWDEQTAHEHDAQLTGFSIEAGDRGYLRESIGGVHAVTWLFPEAFADADGTLDNARHWYGNGGEASFGHAILDALTKGNLVAEATGNPKDKVEALGGGFVDVIDQAAGGFPPEEYCVEVERREYQESWRGEEYTTVAWAVPHDVLVRRLPLAMSLSERRYEGDPEAQKTSQRSLMEFVQLIGELEAAGRNPAIYVSY